MGKQVVPSSGVRTASKFWTCISTQILRADQELFTVLAAEFQQPLKASTVGAKLPLR